jgi:hypothetical protein
MTVRRYGRETSREAHMPNVNVLYDQNEFVVLLFFLVVLIAASEGGYRLGARQQAHADEAHRVHLTDVQTLVFAVLGLLLAFTVAMVVSRFDARKQALVQETNAIGTAYLRTQLLPATARPAAVTLFRAYVDARLASDRRDWDRDTALRQRTAQLQQELWTQGVAAAQQDPRAVTGGVYLQALNDMFDAQSSRDAARLNQLPPTVLSLVVVVSAVGLGILGYRNGIGRGRSLGGEIALALVIGLVVFLILDLDQPYSGLVTISQQSMLQLRESMGSP